MNKQIEEKLPESLLEAIGFEHDEESGDWNWASNDGQHTALVRSDDLKYVTVNEVTRNEDDPDEIEDINPINHEFTIGEFIDEYIFKSVE